MKPLPVLLFHGSSKKLVGDSLLPKKSQDLGDNPFEKLRAVYAADTRSLAIGYAITGCEGVELSGINDKRRRPPYTIINIGWPTNLNTKIYIYTLSSKSFKRVKGEEREFYSLKPVKPLKTEVIKLKDYIHYATKSKDWKPKTN